MAAAGAVDAGRTTPDGVVLIDSLIGAAACCALWTRRRWPVGLAVTLTLSSNR